MQKRVLLAWELGGGRGHAFILGWIAQVLKKRGYRPILAVQHLAALQSIGAELEGIDCLQGPVWPGLIDPGPYWSPGPVMTLGDILSELGLRSPSTTRHMIGAWDALLALVKPDAILADFAPALLLAANGKTPTIAIGECFTLPPSTMDRFVILKNADDKPKYDESRLVEVINSCLRGTARRTISRLPEIFAADRACVGAFAEFDPYDAFRGQPNAGPWAPVWNRWIEKEGNELFCYLGMRSRVQADILKALQIVVRSGINVRIYAPQLSEEAHSLLNAAGIVTERNPVPFTQIQARARLAVSLGSLSFVSCALAGGIPQVVLPTSFVKQKIGDALERLGVGRSLQVEQAKPNGAELLARSLIEIFRDETLAAKARERAPDFERRLEPRPETVVADLVDELV